MITISNIKQELRQFLFKSFKIQSIEDTQDIFETGLVHSLFFIQLLVFIERTFNIILESGEFDIKALKTINAISALVANKLD